jgi:hypothetical protein
VLAFCRLLLLLGRRVQAAGAWTVLVLVLLLTHLLNPGWMVTAQQPWLACMNCRCLQHQQQHNPLLLLLLDTRQRPCSVSP